MKKSLLLALALAFSGSGYVLSVGNEDYRTSWVKEITSKIEAPNQSVIVSNDNSQFCKSMRDYNYPLTGVCFTSKLPAIYLIRMMERNLGFSSEGDSDAAVFRPTVNYFSDGQEKHFTAEGDGFYAIQLLHSLTSPLKKAGWHSILFAYISTTDKFTTDIIVF
ncbi:hypothetical protein Q0M94_19275 (plasmid) [Deinococcus radiomollis]|uniref:hypothetical protein n=1 Tax=Deinococcus radiomollis TaxID=468916 RepID=UPI003892AF06